eukprot:7293579-Prymnesium_polylepis.1
MPILGVLPPPETRSPDRTRSIADLCVAQGAGGRGARRWLACTRWVQRACVTVSASSFRTPVIGEKSRSCLFGLGAARRRDAPPGMLGRSFAASETR